MTVSLINTSLPLVGSQKGAKGAVGLVHGGGLFSSGIVVPLVIVVDGAVDCGWSDGVVDEVIEVGVDSTLFEVLSLLVVLIVVLAI